MVKSCFYHLRLLTKVKAFLSLKKFEMVMHAFDLDWITATHCISVLLSHAFLVFSWFKIKKALLLCGKRKYESITPILISLHWLPVKYKIDFKCLHKLAPQYISDLLQPYKQPYFILVNLIHFTVFVLYIYIYIFVCVCVLYIYIFCFCSIVYKLVDLFLFCILCAELWSTLVVLNVLYKYTLYLIVCVSQKLG